MKKLLLFEEVSNDIAKKYPNIFNLFVDPSLLDEEDYEFANLNIEHDNMKPIVVKSMGYRQLADANNSNSIIRPFSYKISLSDKDAIIQMYNNVKNSINFADILYHHNGVITKILEIDDVFYHIYSDFLKDKEKNKLILIKTLGFALYTHEYKKVFFMLKNGMIIKYDDNPSALNVEKYKVTPYNKINLLVHGCLHDELEFLKLEFEDIIKMYLDILSQYVKIDYVLISESNGVHFFLDKLSPYLKDKPEIIDYAKSLFIFSNDSLNVLNNL